MTMYLIDGVCHCQRCIQLVDSKIIAEQVEFRDAHGIDALRAREQARPTRDIRLGGTQCQAQGHQ